MKMSPGTILDHYKLLARVGAGSCGSVWQAENVVSGELEALKILSRGELVERELRALKLYREINHPALIRVRHIGSSGELFFYTMDWCESSLAERKVSAKELLEIAKTLADGLSLLHSKGLLHRDIKPANILFRQGSPVLGDIGLLTQQEGATFAGSPGFLAPDILSGKSSANCYTDCYALAKSIYCALSGLGPEKFPFYDEEMSPEASLLMRVVIATCSDNNTVHSAEEFSAYLSDPQFYQKTHKVRKSNRRVLFWGIINLCVAGGLWMLFLFFQSEMRPAQTPELPKSVNTKQGNQGLTRNPASGQMEALQKQKELELNQRAYRIISLSGMKEMQRSPEDEEKAVFDKFTPPQQKIYRKCCEEIRTVQSSEKWKKIAKHWEHAGYPEQIRKIQTEENCNGMQALRKITEKDASVIFLVKQAECYFVRNKIVDAALRNENSDFAFLLGTFASVTQAYLREFHRQQ